MDENSMVFPAAEFEGRLSRLRHNLAAIGVDAMLVHIPENIYYLTGYQTPGYYSYQCLIVPVDGETTVVTRKLEATNVSGISYADAVVPFEDTADPAKACADAVLAMGLGGKRIGIEMDAWFLSPKRYFELERQLSTTFVDASGSVETLRLVKSPLELETIREATAIANAGMAAALATIKPGVTENDVAAEVLATVTREGSVYTSLPPFITSGDRSWRAHSTWEGRRLEEGDPVYLEISGTVKRYSGAIMRTAIAGRASDRQKRISATIIEGLLAGIDKMRPGNTSGDVDRACRSVFERDGIAQDFRHRTGYSIGISFPPDWGEGHIAALRDRDPLVLEAGMVFHSPPGVLIEGEAGFGFSDTVIIGEDGPEPLSPLPLELYESGAEGGGT